jgi:hypothetical protein
MAVDGDSDDHQQDHAAERVFQNLQLLGVFELCQAHGIFDVAQGLRERIDLFQDVAVAAIHRRHLGAGGTLIAAGEVTEQRLGLPHHGGHAGFQAGEGAGNAAVVDNFCPDLLLEALEPRPEGQHRRSEAPELARGVPALKYVVSRGIHQTGATTQFGNLVVQGAPGQIGFYRVGENQVDVMSKKEPRNHGRQVECREHIVDVVDPGTLLDRARSLSEPGAACGPWHQREHMPPHAMPDVRSGDRQARPPRLPITGVMGNADDLPSSLKDYPLAVK